jgi:hypothetical protein
MRAAFLLALGLSTLPLGARAGPTEVEAALSPEGLLSRDVDDAGRIVVRLVRPSGDLVDRTVEPDGRIVGERVEGTVRDLPLVQRATDRAGRATRLVRDDRSGALIRYAVDGWGLPADAEVAEDAPGL